MSFGEIRPFYPVKRNLVIFYWLVLLVATLAIGGETFFLLQRESDRLRRMAADNAVNTGQTIVSNLGLLLSDASTNLIDPLAKIPENQLSMQMSNWMGTNTNPYVRSVFLYQPILAEGGNISWEPIVPDVHSPEREKLEPLLHPINGRWVWQRQPGYYAGRAPRPPGPPGPGNDPNSNSMPPDVYAQLRIQQQQIRQIGRNGNFTASTTITSFGSANLPAGNENLGAPDLLNPEPVNSNLIPEITVIQMSNGTITLSLPNNVMQNFAAGNFSAILGNATVAQLRNSLNGNGLLSQPSRSDWAIVGPPENQQWVSWVRSPYGEVRGMVLNLAELEKQMDSAFPNTLQSSVGFILTDPSGKQVVARFGSGQMTTAGGSQSVNDVNAKPAFDPHKVLLVAGGEIWNMPGWKLAVYFNPSASLSSGFMTLSTSLVTVLVITVLTGGTLLMREARREASEAARKTGFVSNVSHELKTPLTTIRMYAELLGEGRVRDPAKQKTYLTTIMSESQRLTRLVNNVLDFSRLEQGRKQYHPDNVSLTEVVQNVLTGQLPRFEEAGFTLETEFPPDTDVRVHTDRDALEQVLLNLIDNALKYAATGNWLKVKVTSDQEHAYLTVSDHGAGVPLAHQERIFEMFHRVDDSITARLPGAGLGLSIARRLLRDQEGDLSYQANEPNGASFVASLPLASVISAAKIK